MQYFVTFLVLQISVWGREGWLHYFCGLLNVIFCYRSLPLPHSAVGWSVVCDFAFPGHTRLPLAIGKSQHFFS